MQLHRDPVLALPSELISACFELLDLKSRIAVSHVCPSWRNVALSDRSLWNEYTVPDEPSRLDSRAGLRAMLLRSDPAPFRLTCLADVPDALVELLAQNMHRMQVLRLSNIRPSAVRHMMSKDAPVLNTFSYYWSPEPIIPITLTWSDNRAPRLRNVRLLKFLIPDDCTFFSMDSFGGTLPNGCRLSRSLMSIFPALTEIHLHCITQAALDPLLPLPPTMTSVTLISARVEPIDYTSFLKGCAPATLSHLRIDSATLASLAPAVEQFMCASDGPWELHLGRDHDMDLRAEPDVSYTVFCYSREPLVLQPSLTDFLRRISTLSLYTRHYTELYGSTAWDRRLPALDRLVLGVRVRRGTVHPADMFDAGGAAIEAPVLESITIETHGKGRDSVLVLPYVAPLLRSLTCPRLEVISLLATHTSPLLEADLSCIAGLAPRIYVSDLDGNRTVTVYMDDDR